MITVSFYVSPVAVMCLNSHPKNFCFETGDISVTHILFESCTI